MNPFLKVDDACAAIESCLAIAVPIVGFILWLLCLIFGWNMPGAGFP